MFGIVIAKPYSKIWTLVRTVLLLCSYLPVSLHGAECAVCVIVLIWTFLLCANDVSSQCCELHSKSDDSNLFYTFQNKDLASIHA